VSPIAESLRMHRVRGGSAKVSIMELVL